jgi:hypothetical protein
MKILQPGDGTMRTNHSRDVSQQKSYDQQIETAESMVAFLEHQLDVNNLQREPSQIIEEKEGG